MNEPTNLSHYSDHPRNSAFRKEALASFHTDRQRPCPHGIPMSCARRCSSSWQNRSRPSRIGQTGCWQSRIHCQPWEWHVEPLRPHIADYLLLPDSHGWRMDFAWLPSHGYDRWHYYMYRYIRCERWAGLRNSWSKSNCGPWGSPSSSWNCPISKAHRCSSHPAGRNDVGSSCCLPNDNPMMPMPRYG